MFSNPPTIHRQQSLSDVETARTAPQDHIHETKPPVLELTGASPGSGKTRLLHQLIALTLLPSAHSDTPSGGRASAVALLDLTSSYSLLRLERVLECYIKSCLSTRYPSKEVCEGLMKGSLQHLHIFRPQTHQSLLASIDNLPNYFLSNTSSHYSANRPLGAIVINNLSAFFWQDRQDAEEYQNATFGESNTTFHSPEDDLFLTRYRLLTSSLRQVQQLFDCPVIVTDWALATPVHSRDGSSLRPHLPGVWNQFRSVNIVLQRNSVTKFGPGMSVVEALGEREQRWEAVSRSGYSGWLNWWDSEGWKEEVKIAARAWGRHGGLRYDLAETDITFDEHARAT